jgi:hypothetical protein
MSHEQQAIALSHPAACSSSVQLLTLLEAWKGGGGQWSNLNRPNVNVHMHSQTKCQP